MDISVSARTTPAFDIVGKTYLSPKVWLDDVYKHVNPSKTLSKSQWEGVRDALQAVFRTYDSKHHLLFQNFDEAVKGIKKDAVNDIQEVTALQSLLVSMSDVDGYEIEMIQYANAIRDGIFGRMSGKEKFTAREMEMMTVGCLLISSEMGFSADQVKNAAALKAEIADDVTGDHSGRITRAIATVCTDYTYGALGPTELRKGFNHFCSGLFGWR